MATTTATPTASRTVADLPAPVTPESTAVGPLLVATDASESADTALVAAQVLAQRLHAEVQVISVFEPAPLYLPPPQLLALPADFDTGAMDRLRQRARLQVRKVVGEDWPVDVQAGDPATTVRQVARDRAASLVITGLSRHGLMDRVFGEETAAQIASVTDVPMLAATPSFSGLPRIVLITIDLDSPPIVPTPLIRELLSDASAVYFINAKPRATVVDGFDLSSWERMYDEGIAEVYERMKMSLDLPGRVSQQLITLNGPTAKEVLSFAEYANVELVIVGQRRGSLLQRRFRRGLATQVLRATTCPVLVLPRPAGQAQMPARQAKPASRDTTTTITDPREWAPRLGELSHRTVGRTVMVEIDDLTLGAQAQASGYPFAGADYDHRDDRVEIMLGARGPGRNHLTHSVDRPTSVDIVERPDGSLVALRIANERGQVVVSFVT